MLRQTWEAEMQNYQNGCGKPVFSGFHWHIGYAKVSGIGLDVITAKEKGMFFACDISPPAQAVVHKDDLESHL